MNRVVHILLESFTASDGDGVPMPEGLKLTQFDTTGVENTHAAIVRVLNGSVPTKLFSARWMAGFWTHDNAEPGSGGTLFKGQYDYRMVEGQPEPNEHWDAFLKFLDQEFHDDAKGWRHVVYLTRRGHAGSRFKRGVPGKLEDDYRLLLDLVTRDVLPRLRRGTALIAHNDHGTRRSGRDFAESMSRGFMWSAGVPTPPTNYAALPGVLAQLVADR